MRFSNLIGVAFRRVAVDETVRALEVDRRPKWIPVAFVAAVCCVWLAKPATAGFFDDVMSLGPVAYWRLGDSGDGDGNEATDEIGNHHGTYIGGVTLEEPGAVVGGNTAARFDEFDDYVLIPDFEYGEQFSVAFFFKQDDLDGTAYQYIFSHNSYNQPDSLNIYFREDGEAVPREIRTILNLDAGEGLTPDARADFADGEWHFYTLTVSATCCRWSLHTAHMHQVSALTSRRRC